MLPYFILTPKCKYLYLIIIVIRTYCNIFFQTTEKSVKKKVTNHYLSPHPYITTNISFPWIQFYQRFFPFDVPF